MYLSVVEIFIKCAFALLFVMAYSSTEAADFAESRCHCLCPDVSVVHGSDPVKRYVYINHTLPDDCNCKVVVGPKVKNSVPKDRLSEFCSRCECKFQTRNIAMIKVVVIGVIFIISALVMYMLFLVLMDPVFRQRQASHHGFQRHLDEDDFDDNIFARPSSQSGGEGNVVDVTIAEGHAPTAAASITSGGTRILSRVSQHRERWMDQVQEQRRNIFRDHTMLN